MNEEVRFMPLSADSTIGSIAESPRGQAVLEQFLPKLLRLPAYEMTRCMRFRALAQSKGWKLNDAQIAEADALLRAIEDI